MVWWQDGRTATKREVKQLHRFVGADRKEGTDVTRHRSRDARRLLRFLRLRQAAPRHNAKNLVETPGFRVMIGNVRGRGSRSYINYTSQLPRLELTAVLSVTAAVMTAAVTGIARECA